MPRSIRGKRGYGPDRRRYLAACAQAARRAVDLAIVASSLGQASVPDRRGPDAGVCAIREFRVGATREGARSILPASIGLEEKGLWRSPVAGALAAAPA